MDARAGGVGVDSISCAHTPLPKDRAPHCGGALLAYWFSCLMVAASSG